MSNFQAYNDKVWTFPPLKVANTAVPPVLAALPAGSAPAATSSLPASLSVTVDGLNRLVMTPKVQNSLGITVTVTGVALQPAVMLVDVLADPNLLTITVDTTPANINTTSQAVPVNPGP